MIEIVLFLQTAWISAMKQHPTVKQVLYPEQEQVTFFKSVLAKASDYDFALKNNSKI